MEDNIFISIIYQPLIFLKLKLFYPELTQHKFFLNDTYHLYLDPRYIASLCVLFKANKVPLAPKQRPQRERPASSVITATPISILFDDQRWAEKITARAIRTPWTIATRHRYLIPCTITAVICWALVRPTTTSPSEREKITRTSGSHIWASRVLWRPRRNCKFHDPNVGHLKTVAEYVSAKRKDWDVILQTTYTIVIFILISYTRIR